MDSVIIVRLISIFLALFLASLSLLLLLLLHCMFRSIALGPQLIHCYTLYLCAMPYTHIYYLLVVLVTVAHRARSQSLDDAIRRYIRSSSPLFDPSDSSHSACFTISIGFVSHLECAFLWVGVLVVRVVRCCVPEKKNEPLVCIKIKTEHKIDVATVATGCHRHRCLPIVF